MPGEIPCGGEDRNHLPVTVVITSKPGAHATHSAALLFIVSVDIDNKPGANEPEIGHGNKAFLAGNQFRATVGGSKLHHTAETRQKRFTAYMYKRS